MHRLTLVALLLLSMGAAAQTLQGRVTTPEGKPIEGAYVYNLRTGSHGHANEFGSFLIDRTGVGDLLRIGLLGYATREVTVLTMDPLVVVLETSPVSLDELVITPQYDGPGFVSGIDLKVIPVRSSQEILRKVPGLFIGQHAGGGKAEQLFLRGFDVDHGTDVNISVDGMPVNMVSHAHGQGYADLHFVIPETVEEIDWGKGPYNADKGDFTTAGYVGFRTRERLAQSTIGMELGQFNTQRLVGLFDLLDNKLPNHDAYIATELILTDGPFETAQNFGRVNLFGKYTARVNNKSKLSLTASHFSSQWEASGQIPVRAVNDGSIGWFGAIDDTEGGNTKRTNVNASYFTEIDSATYFKANIFYSRYGFELYSNFTFFLEDSVNGDQIRQKEARNIYGLNSEWGRRLHLGSTRVDLRAGLGYRADAIRDVELSRSFARQVTLEPIRLGDIDQSTLAGYVEARFGLGRLAISPSVRVDHFQFNYYDKLDSLYNNQVERQTIASPKLSFVYTQSEALQLYLKSGLGFHSNDARVVVSEEGRQTLPRAYGADLGAVWKPGKRVMLNGALWYLFLEQEFVYVGDAGIVEPSGRSQRMGVDGGVRYQLTDHLFFDCDVNYAFARSIDEAPGEDFIPLAPDLTSTAGIALVDWKGFSGSYRFRYMRDRPANEDNSIVAVGFMVSDVSLNYQPKRLLVGITIENIFNTAWKETQFATESRLRDELESVEEIHFTPGVPLFARARVAYNF
ncbi:MAG: TonB-dependent receptor plug domain-containing protein [Flavobacteriales bacterium]|nr:TonB-dependent receptor plug domain-containing protein [Flavobacteriales bacterium]